MLRWRDDQHRWILLKRSDCRCLDSESRSLGLGYIVDTNTGRTVSTVPPPLLVEKWPILVDQPTGCRKYAVSRPNSRMEMSYLSCRVGSVE